MSHLSYVYFSLKRRRIFEMSHLKNGGTHDNISKFSYLHAFHLKDHVTNFAQIRKRIEREREREFFSALYDRDEVTSTLKRRVWAATSRCLIKPHHKSSKENAAPVLESQTLVMACKSILTL
ncbi:hypothetical protein AMTRI_Chr08g160530 [Amborella trichopoda]